MKGILTANQRGAGLIVVVVLLLIMGMIGAVFVSLINTESFTAMNQSLGLEAFYIADGGKEYILKRGPFPNYSTQGTTIPLGAGNFKTATSAYLTAAVAVGDTPINVDSTSSFPGSGRIRIDGEVMSYTAKIANQFTLSPGATQTHTSGNSVYPVTTVTDNPLLAASTTINVASTTGFVVPGVIQIDNEAIFCPSTNAPSTTQFTNCTRGYSGTTAAAHTAGSNIFQFVISSTGTTASFPAQRVVRTDITGRVAATTTNTSWTLAGNSKEWVLGAVALRPTGAIAFDAAKCTQSNSANPLSWSHTVSGSNPVMVVGVAIGGATNATGVTYAGQALTKIGSLTYAGGNTIRAEIWYLANPPTGTANNVVVSLTASTAIAAGSISLTGVDTTNPIDAPPSFNSGTTPVANSTVSVLVNTATNNAVVVDVLSFKPTVQNPGAGQTERWPASECTGTGGAAVKGAGSTKVPFAWPAGASRAIIWQEVY